MSKARNWRENDPDKNAFTQYGVQWGPLTVSRCISVQKGNTSYWVLTVETAKASIEIQVTGTGKLVNMHTTKKGRKNHG
jgi:hypothetical protein